MADNITIEDHDVGGDNASLPENGPSNTGDTTQWNMLQQFQQQQNYLTMLYSQKISLLLQPNVNYGLKINPVDADNSVAPSPNPMSLSDSTPTKYPRVSKLYLHAAQST